MPLSKRAANGVPARGALYSRRMHEPLARALAAPGSRVLSLDRLGHGDSDRPPEMLSYSMTTFGRQAIALLDHAGVERAVLGGASLAPTRRSRPPRPRRGASRDS